MSIPPSLFLIHWVFSKDGVEYVRRVDLGGQVAVVACVVAADKVSECGLAVAPIAMAEVVNFTRNGGDDRNVIDLPRHSKRLRTIEARYLCS
jgi:hypothetical protein